jgi:type I restriction enzyme, S subunit
MKQLVRLGDVAHINPRFDKSSLADDVPVSFVQMASVGASDGKINVSIVRPFSEVKKGSYTPFKDGDVLFAKVTPCMENGKMAVARGLTNGVGFGSSEFHVLRPSDQVDAKYLYYFVSSQAFRKEAAGHMTGAVGLRRVPAAFLADAQLPMVPLNEQLRIVAEIEKQFSRLDEAVANLQRVKANLKRYKASVLKAAVEGRLVETEASIAQREGRTYETGEQLLQRILEVRRERPKGKSKYKEPASPNLEAVTELPKGWAWASVEQVVAHLTDGDHQAPPQTDSGIPFLVIGNVRTGEIDLSNTRFVGEDYYNALDPYRQPTKGDLLYTLVGSYGIPVRVKITERFCVQRHMAILRPHAQSPMDYLTIAMASDNLFKQATEVSTGTAQMTVPLGGLRSIAFGLPPKSEQNRIVAEVDRHLSIIREVEAEVDTNLQRAQVMRQALLNRAFATC